MPSRSRILSLLLLALACLSVAAPQHYNELEVRQATTSTAPDTSRLLPSALPTPGPIALSNVTTGAVGNATILEPIVPPAVNESDHTLLIPNNTVTLAWAGATGSQPGTKNRLKRSSSIASQGTFSFTYPTVPLDHSTYISGVTCSPSQLTGTLSSSAYATAQQQWSSAGNILFITGVNGCGPDAGNIYFVATSVAFNAASMTFTATGSAAALKDILGQFNLQYGNIGTTNAKRAVDKSIMFESHTMEKRFDYTDSWTVEWGTWLQDDDYLGTDDDAPWEDAALLYEWGTDGGEEDDSRDEGEDASSDHYKRHSTDETSLKPRDDGLEYGLKLYCVDCGFGGTATFSGEVAGCVLCLDPGLTTVTADLSVDMEAGFSLGLDAYVDYSQTWQTELDEIDFDGIVIFDLIEATPFVSVSVEVDVDIEATGTLLIGANASWDGMDFHLDILNPSQSGLTFPDPTFLGIAEAKGELSASISLGLPLELGIKFSVLDWGISAGFVDKPSIVAEGVFEVSASIDSNGDIDTDVNDGCYGIAWDVHFENEIDAQLKLDEDVNSYTLFGPTKSAPIAQGCIGYVDNGDGTDDSANGDGSSSGTTGNGLGSSGNGLNGSPPGSPGGAGGSSPSSSTVSSVKTVSSSASSVNAPSSSIAVSSTQSSSSSPASSSVSPSSSKQTSSTSAVASSTPSKSASSPSSSTSTSSTSTKSTSTKSTSSSTSPSSSASLPSSSKPASSSTPTSSSIAPSSSKPTSSSSKPASSAPPTSSSKPASSSPPTSSGTIASSIPSPSSSRATSSTASSSTKPTTTCKASTTVITATSTASTVSCSKTVTHAAVPSATSVDVGSSKSIANSSVCAAQCFGSTSCLSFSFVNGTSASVNGTCQLYNKAFSALNAASNGGNTAPTMTFWDHACFAYNTC